MRLLPLALLLLAAPAWAEPVTVEVQGSGLTREVAVTRALSSAVEQVTGVALRADALSTQSATISSGDEGSRTELSSSAATTVQRRTGGIIRGYRILSVEQQPDEMFLAVLEVEVERFQPVQRGTETRRRIVVSGFVDPRGQRTRFGDQLQERLVQHLAQSRRFAVLDRSHLATYDREMALLATDAPLAERVRIGQVVGADYVVVGRLRNVGATRNEQVIGLTGERVTSQAARGDLDFQVLEIATRQVAWAGSVSASSGGSLDQVLETMATRLGRGIAETIYPLRLIRMEDPQQLVLNQGGVTVNAGQRFRAMLLGEEVTDPYTRESLGRVESEVAVVQVTRVDERLSYARLISGTLTPGSDVVLRLAPPAPPAPAAPQRRRPDNRSMFD